MKGRFGLAYMLGLDIGGTKSAVSLARVGKGIEILSRVSFPTETHKGFKHSRQKLFSAVRGILGGIDGEERDIAGIGVSCGGPLDSRRGIILSPPNLPGWDNIPFAQMLYDEFGIPAFIQNDANACALAEWKLGAGRGCDNLIFLTMGTGMGAGIISQGVLLQGQNGMAGEVGHIRLEEEGPVGYHKAGSFEGFCRGGGIGRLAREVTKRLLAQGREVPWIMDGIALEDIDARIIADYADSGCEEARDIYRLVGSKLGKGLSILIDILNPGKIIIGSIFVRSRHLLIESMEEAVSGEALGCSRRACEIVPAGLGESIGDYAAIMAACYALGIEPEHGDAAYASDNAQGPDGGIIYRAAGSTSTEGAWGKAAGKIRSGGTTDTNIDMDIFERLFKRYPELNPQRDSIFAAYNLMRDAYKNGKKLLVCGNGGSSADADHIVGELMKGFNKKRPIDVETASRIDSCFKGYIERASTLLQGALPAVALTQHTALSTAFSNDVRGDMVFAQQLYGYGSAGDVLLAISTSGNACNVVNAAILARALGIPVVGLTGQPGGQLADLCDVLIAVPGSTTAEIQELHLPIYHTLCAMLEQTFF